MELFDSGDLTGTAANVGVGFYGPDKLQEEGAQDNTISSISVGPGCIAQVTTHTSLNG